MSSFGGLNIAASGLAAARAALEVTGQNVANANTVGYTRQRVDQAALTQATLATYATQNGVGDGVSVIGISRMNDAVVDAQVRSTAATSAYWSTTSSAISTVETSLNEPSTNGLGETMTNFFNAWQTMANNPGDAATANTLISSGQQLASTLASGYQTAANAWSDARSAAVSTVATVNDTAATIANLNNTIRSLSASGSTGVNALLDQRDVAITKLAGLTGATTRTNGDGTVDVIVGGNALVSGTTARPITLTGGATFPPSTATGLTWGAGGPPVSLDGGELAARVATLAPANGGTGGVFAEAAQTYDTLTTTIAGAVNAIHEQGVAAGSGATTAQGLDFFAITDAQHPASSLTVVPTGVSGIAAADPAKGSLDNTIADRIAQIATATTVATPSNPSAPAPGVLWTNYVSQVGAQSASATARSTSATTAATAATTAQTSASGVDLDQETSNLVLYQHAYQASARVISTIDTVLDTLINMGA